MATFSDPNEKSSQPAPVAAPKVVRGPTGFSTSTTQSVPADGQHISSNTVAVMQKQIISLYNSFKANSDLVKWFGKDKEPAVESEEFRKGPYAFLQSLLNRYIDGATQRANQYDLTMPDAKDYTAPGKQLSRSSFLQYLNMLRIVGTHTTQQKVAAPDGKWGEYTNNALKAAWSIGFAMTSIADKLKIKDFPLKLDDMQKFSKLIPPSVEGMNEEKKAINAKLISVFLDKIIKSVPLFINMMKSSAQGYSEYISGDKRFEMFSGTKEGLNPEQQTRAVELANSFVPGLDKMFTGLKFKDILNLNSFQNWIKTTKQPDIGRTAASSYLTDLKRQLTVALEQAKAVKSSPELARELQHLKDY